jgi:hypothetical protein
LSDLPVSGQIIAFTISGMMMTFLLGMLSFDFGFGFCDEIEKQ